MKTRSYRPEFLVVENKVKHWEGNGMFFKMESEAQVYGEWLFTVWPCAKKMRIAERREKPNAKIVSRLTFLP